MKSTNHILAVCAGLVLILTSCKRDSEFLKEVQKDKLNTENAFLSKAQFDELSASMYRSVQLFYNSADGNKDGWILGLGTDVCFDPRDNTTKYNNWGW